MPERSAGLLVFRRGPAGIEFLLAHPGGPFWKNRDAGAWTIPKGLIGEGEAPSAAARREFEEETGLAPPEPLAELEPRRQKSGKWVHCWLAEASLDLAPFRSNPFELEWPRGSGRRERFAEIDRIGYFPAGEAMERILAGQRPILVEALERIFAGEKGGFQLSLE